MEIIHNLTLSFSKKQTIFPNEKYLDRIEWQVPPMKELQLQEGLFGADYTFQTIPYFDFMFILTNLLIENHILFFSKNQNLLTYTMLTLFTAVKPFQYIMPFCNCMEEMGEHGLEIICGAITHSFFGINQSSDGFMKSSHYQSLTREQKQQMLIVDLDKYAIVSPVMMVKDMMKYIPFSFYHNEELMSEYAKFNSRASMYFKMDTNPQVEVEQPLGNRNNSQTHIDTSETVIRIFELIQQFYNENIIDYFPKHDFCENQDFFDVLE